MTSNAPFPHNLTEIDTLTRPDHYRLDTTDTCLFLGEYTARRNFSYSKTNQLIWNLKKTMDRRGLPEWRHKGVAIQQAGVALRAAINPAFIQQATFVPIPPSKAKTDPLYDDRMIQVLKLLGPNTDIRELIIQIESTEACHRNDDGRDPEEIKENYIFNKTFMNPAPSQFAICDDVLTTGAHFKAVQSMLLERFPGIPIYGIFIARRAPEAIDFEEFLE